MDNARIILFHSPHILQIGSSAPYISLHSSDLKPDSWVNIYRQSQDESTIVLQIEQSEGVSGSISTGTNRFRTRIFLPEPNSSTPLPDGTVISSSFSPGAIKKR